MPRALFLCTSIVAAFQIHLAAASPNVENVPVTPGALAIAARLGFDASRDRAAFLPEITRLLYTPPEGRSPLRAARIAAPASTPVDASFRAPVPLAASLWSRAVFHRTVPPEELIEAILADRRAALVAYGLTGMDDETLAFIAEHPSLLTFFHERAAAAVAAFGESFHVAGGRVAVPGGAAALPLWEAVIHEPTSAPEPFAKALFGDAAGRLAYLYSVVASADRSAAAFALGSWIPDPHVRLERFTRLADACVRNYSEWRIDSLPFSRPLSDLAVLLLRLRVLPSGAPAAPAGRRFWGEVFEINDQPASDVQSGAEDGLVDAAWLVDATGGSDMYSRGDRLDQFAFGQRAFADLPGESSGVAVDALRTFGRTRMLLLTLERMGVHAPSFYAAAVRQAFAVGSSGRDRRFWMIAQFQGALALVSRLHRSQSIDDAEAERLVLSIAGVAVDDGGYNGRMAEWIEAVLAADLPAGDSWEERVAAGLAGRQVSAVPPRLFWEGQSYRIDLPFAERRRLEVIRAKQGGHTIDLALRIQAHARAVRQLSGDGSTARALAAAVRATATENEALLRRPAVNLLPPGVETPADGFDWMRKAADDLARPGDPRRAPRVAASLSELADIVLGDALASIAYAVDLGDAEGTVLLGTNVALRHDFGLGRRDRAARVRMPWILPRQDFMPGVPWHINGSLLGLDIALAPLALRRTTLDGLPDAPKLGSIEREAFAVNVSLMEPSRLTDRDRDAIAEAIDRGRQRIAHLAPGPESVSQVANTLMLDGRRRRSVEWTHQYEPAAVAGQFSLAELFALGGGASGANVDAWGVSGVHAWGCACTRFLPPTAWRILAGRAQLPLMAGTLTELNLSIVLMMRDMKLPAALTRSVLAAATRDFIDDSAPADANDWWSLARTAQSLRRQRIEDYVAGAAAVDGPLVPDQSDVSPQP